MPDAPANGTGQGPYRKVLCLSLAYHEPGTAPLFSARDRERGTEAPAETLRGGVSADTSGRFALGSDPCGGAQREDNRRGEGSRGAVVREVPRQIEHLRGVNDIRIAVETGAVR